MRRIIFLFVISCLAAGCNSGSARTSTKVLQSDVDIHVNPSPSPDSTNAPTTPVTALKTGEVMTVEQPSLTPDVVNSPQPPQIEPRAVTITPTDLPLPIKITPAPKPCKQQSNIFGLSEDLLKQLGCSSGPVSDRQAIVQRFEGGVMVIFAKVSNQWDSQPGATIYALSDSGRAWRFVDGFGETSSNPDDWYACERRQGQRPEQSDIPWRGFGKVWCESSAVRRALGNVRSAEMVGAVADFVSYDLGRAFRLNTWHGFGGWQPNRVYVIMLDGLPTGSSTAGRWQ